LRSGLHFLDYSASYGNEHLVGSCIRRSGVPRKDLLITTRITNHAQFTHTQRDCVLRSLENMGLDYIDVLMFHWPVTDHYLETWKVMESLHKEGIAKILGVANCHEHHLKPILEECEIKPLINQVECHPLLSQKPLLTYCKENGIVMEAYTPIMRFDPRCVQNPVMQNLAQAHQKSVAQIIWRWHIQNGVIPAIRAMKPKHQSEIFGIFDFELSPEEMLAIDGINQDIRIRYDPDNCDFRRL
jgi:diketogulonate reductase-like aldo/keto reductase